MSGAILHCGIGMRRSCITLLQPRPSPVPQRARASEPATCLEATTVGEAFLRGAGFAFATGIFAFGRLRRCRCGLTLADSARTCARLQFRETLVHELFQPLQVRRGMHIAGETEVRGAVVGEDGAIDTHQAADRHPRVPLQHFVAHQVKRHLRAGDVGANNIAQAKRQLADNRSNIGPECARKR